MIRVLRALGLACGRAQCEVAEYGSSRGMNRDMRRGGAAMLDRSLDQPTAGHPLDPSRRGHAHSRSTR